jgi:hypothetical protein
MNLEIISSLTIPGIVILLVVAFIFLWIDNIKLKNKINELNNNLGDKNSPYNQAIYIRQIDGCFDLIEIMQKIKALISEIYKYFSKDVKDDVISIRVLKAEANSSDDFKKIEDFAKKLKSYKNEYRNKLDKWVIVLPKNLRINFVGFIEKIDYDRLDLQKITKAYIRISTVVYQELGIEPPNEELKRMMEKTSKLANNLTNRSNL